MLYYTIKFADGNSISSRINATPAEICKKFPLGEQRNIGGVHDNYQQIVSVEIQLEKAVLTNADRIRHMSNESLAMTIGCPNDMCLANIPCNHDDTCDCYLCCLNWLKSPCA